MGYGLRAVSPISAVVVAAAAVAAVTLAVVAAMVAIVAAALRAASARALPWISLAWLWAVWQLPSLQVLLVLSYATAAREAGRLYPRRASCLIGARPSRSRGHPPRAIHHAWCSPECARGGMASLRLRQSNLRGGRPRDSQHWGSGCACNHAAQTAARHTLRRSVDVVAWWRATTSMHQQPHRRWAM